MKKLVLQAMGVGTATGRVSNLTRDKGSKRKRIDPNHALPPLVTFVARDAPPFTLKQLVESMEGVIESVPWALFLAKVQTVGNPLAPLVSSQEFAFLPILTHHDALLNEKNYPTASWQLPANTRDELLHLASRLNCKRLN